MRNKWALLAFLCATFVIYTIDRALLGPLAIPIQKDTGITDVQFGVLNAAVFWTYAAVVPFAGYAGDRFDRLKLIGLASVVWSAMTVLAGFSTGFWSLLLLIAVAVTAPQTFYSPAAAALIASRHRETRTVAMSCHQAAFYAGWFLSGVSVAAILAWLGSWRAAYFVFGGMGLLLGVVFLVAESSGVDMQRARCPLPQEKTSFAASLRAFFGCPSAVIAALGHVAFTTVAFGYSAWGPKFVALKFNLTPGKAGAGVMFWHFAVAFVAILLAGVVTDRFVGRYPRFRLALQTVALLAAAPLLGLFGFSPALIGVWIAAAAFGFAKGLFEANSFNSLFDVVSPAYRSSAVGFLNVLSGVIGSSAPIFLGAMSQSKGVRGLEIGFAVLGGFLLLACALMCLSLFFTFKRDRITE